MTVLTKDIATGILDDLAGADLDLSDTTYTSIAEGAFGIGWNSSAKVLDSVILPPNITSIGPFAFNGTELDSIELPDGLEVIERAAFQGNNFTSITIPDSVESIGDYAFGSNALESIEFAGTAPDDPSKLRGAFRRNKLSSFEVPAHWTEIPYGILNENEFTEFVVPEHIEKIEGEAFSNNQISNLVLPDGLKEIGSNAFYRNQLTDISIPDGVETVGSFAFMDNAIESLVVPESVVDIGNHAFAYNNISSLALSEGLVEIGSDAFRGNAIKVVQLPESLKKLGGAAFTDNLISGLVKIPIENSYDGNGDPTYEETIGSNPFNENADLMFIVVKPDSPSFSNTSNAAVVKNNAPEGIEFSPSASVVISESVSPLTAVSKITAIDKDFPGTFGALFTYELVDGSGDDDNDAFQLIGDILQIKESPDFDTKGSYSIRVKATDINGLGDSVEQQLSIAVSEAKAGSGSGSTSGSTAEPSAGGASSSLSLLGVMDDFLTIQAFNAPADGSLAIAADTKIPYLWSSELKEWISVQGLPGIQGVKGEKGDKGEKGKRGNRGKIGPAGQDGRDADFVIHVGSATQPDPLTGQNGGQDLFSIAAKRKYNRKNAVSITNFSPEDSDQILLDLEDLGLNNIRFKSVANARAVKRHASKPTNLIYNEINGKLLIDFNAKEDGFGGGGLLARFEEGTLLSKDSFMVEIPAL